MPSHKRKRFRNGLFFPTTSLSQEESSVSYEFKLDLRGVEQNVELLLTFRSNPQTKAKDGLLQIPELHR